MNSEMKKAAFIIIIIELVSVALSNPDFMNYTLANNIIGAIVTIAWIFYLVYFVNFLRTHLVDNSLSVKTIGTWGYVWRALLIRWASFFITIIALALFKTLSSNLPPAPSVQFTMFFSFLSFLTSLALGFIFFSKNRIEQLKWLMYILGSNRA